MKRITYFMNMKVTKFAKRYKNLKVLITAINSEKRILLLQGANGSGKSTLLKGIGNLISYNGEIIFKGTISYMNEVIRFPGDLKVKELINAFNCIDIVSHELLTELIDQFELSKKLDNTIESLSKGMKMKLQLVCAFLTDRDIYVLDEPFSGLDPASVEKLKTYIQNSKKSFIIASHIDVKFQKDCDVILL